MAETMTIFIVGLIVLLLVVIAVTIFMLLQWNIPVVILRYQGDKRRPQITITKGRKTRQQGVNRLYVKGYKMPVADFKAENYYPAKKSKHGGLLLWEPKPGILTPVLPTLRKKELEKLDSQELEKYNKIRELYKELGGRHLVKPIEFDFDDTIYYKLLLKAVDDVDIDFLLQQYDRIDNQYTTGWRDFLAKHASHIVIMFVMICLLTGFIVWLKESPELMAKCASAAQEQSTLVFERFSERIRPPG